MELQTSIGQQNYHLSNSRAKNYEKIGIIIKNKIQVFLQGHKQESKLFHGAKSLEVSNLFNWSINGLP